MTELNNQAQATRVHGRGLPNRNASGSNEPRIHFKATGLGGCLCRWKMSTRSGRVIAPSQNRAKKSRKPRPRSIPVSTRRTRIGGRSGSGPGLPCGGLAIPARRSRASSFRCHAEGAGSTCRLRRSRLECFSTAVTTWATDTHSLIGEVKRASIGRPLSPRVLRGCPISWPSWPSLPSLPC